MSWSHNRVVGLLVTAAFAGLWGCGGNDPSTTHDITPPTAQASPASGNSLGLGAPVVILFSESMAPGSLTMGGTLAPQSDGGVWSSRASANDTLTVSPSSAWTPGTANLQINATDLSGNVLAFLELVYDAGGPDLTAPTIANALPPDGAAMGATDTVRLRFSEIMQRPTVVIGGTMANEAAAPTWSVAIDFGTGVSTDVINIAPTTSWSGGAGRTLIIDGADPAGNTMVTAVVTYDVDTLGPAVFAVPVSGGALGVGTGIVLTFNEPINTSSLVLAGTLASEASAGVWSAGDTVLTVSPTTTWTATTGVTLVVDAEDAFGNAMTPQLVLTYDIDVDAPSITITPTAGLLRVDDAITLLFDSDVDPTSLSLSGGLVAGKPLVTNWSANTATVSAPGAGGWSVGAGQDLVVDIQDIGGNSTRSTTQFDVGVVHVSVGDPAAADCVWNTDCAITSGTVAQPLESIHAAIALAIARGLAPLEVRAAAGSYLTGSMGPVVLAEGVSMLGGYALDFASRDPSTNPTLIGGSDSTGSPPYRAVEAGPGISPATVVDGFMIAGRGNEQCAIYVAGGSPTFTGNTLRGDGAPAATVTATQAVCVLSGAPVFDGNDIFGMFVVSGSLGAQPVATGVRVEGGTPRFLNNTIVGNSNGGNPPPTAYAVHVVDGAPELTGNEIMAGRTDDSTGSLGIGILIDAGTADITGNTFIRGGVIAEETWAVRIAGGSPTIDGNRIDGGAGRVAAGGVEILTGATPTVSGNTITGRSAGSCAGFRCDSSGLYCDGSAGAVVIDNTIDGVGGSAAPPEGNAIGMVVTCNGSIRRNTISSGAVAAGSSATGVVILGGGSIDSSVVLSSGSGVLIELGGATGGVANCTIEALTPIDFVAGRPSLSNNIFIGTDPTLSTCVRETKPGLAPSVFGNNLMTGCQAHGYYDLDTDTDFNGVCDPNDCDTAVTVGRVCNRSCSIPVRPPLFDCTGVWVCDTLADLAVGGNLAMSPQLDVDFRPTSTTPLAVTEGGRDFSPGFTDDRDGVARTVPWSMGAFEAD